MVNDLGQEILVKFMVQSLKFKHSWIQLDSEKNKLTNDSILKKETRLNLISQEKIKPQLFGSQKDRTPKLAYTN